MVEIYAIRIDEPIEEETFNQFLSCVSEEKRERIKRFHFVENAKRTLYGDLMVRSLICGKLKLHNDKLTFCCNEYGKPFLEGYPDFHYNISHSGDWVVCAISEKEIGIVIEKIKSVDFDIAKRFFSDVEYKLLMSQPEDLKTNYFYDIWTLKESYIKYKGKGLSIPLNSFSIISKDTTNILSENIQSVYFLRVLLDQKYKFCAECNIPDSIPQANVINIKKIKEILLYGY